MQQDHSKYARVRKQGQRHSLIHAICDVYQQDKTEAVLLVDADNAFSSINTTPMLHNISITCPVITTFITNCYMEPARLFIVGNNENQGKVQNKETQQQWALML